MNKRRSAVIKRRPESESRGEKIKRVSLNIALTISVALVLFTTISTVFISKKDAFLFGYKPYIVSSESMAPLYKKNAIVVVKKGNFDDVQVGDVIAFKAMRIGGQAAFHRVIEITPDGLVTKGDANKLPDDQIVSADTYLGKEVWHTNLPATLIPLVQTTKGFIFVIVLPLLLIVLLVITVKVLKRRYR